MASSVKEIRLRNFRGVMFWDGPEGMLNVEGRGQRILLHGRRRVDAVGWDDLMEGGKDGKAEWVGWIAFGTCIRFRKALWIYVNA